jgi:hypothetical protein
LLTLDSDLASAYALTMLGVRERDENEDGEYYEEVLDLNFSEFIDMFSELAEGKAILTEDEVLEVALFCYELGRRHEMHKKDMEWLNGNK